MKPVHDVLAVCVALAQQSVNDIDLNVHMGLDGLVSCQSQVESKEMINLKCLLNSLTVDSC